MKLVEVTWEDAASLVDTWCDRSVAVSKEGRSLVRVTSVGCVLHRDKHVLVLARSVAGDRVGGVAIIPRAGIVKERRLR